MRKITLLFLFVGTLFSFQSFAGNGDLFNYDKAEIESQFAELTALETLILQNESLTYDDLLEANNPLVIGLNTSGSILAEVMNTTPILPPFWWGCLLGPVGVLAVYILDDTPANTKRAFWGCLISTLVSGAYYGLFGWGVY